jgi:hypothetical protein
MNQDRRSRGLGDLPPPLRGGRPRTGEVLEPGKGHIADWSNRYTLSLFPFSIGTSPERVLPANPMRCYLLIQNKSAGTIFVNFGQNPTTTASVEIIAGGNLELIGGAQGGAFCSPDDVYLMGSAAALATAILEGLWTSVSN